MNKKGFTLIECMVYAAVLSLFMVMVQRFFFNSYKSLITCTSKIKIINAISSARVLLARDLADSAGNQIDQPKINHYYWHNQQAHAIAWKIKDGFLRRYQWSPGKQKPSSALIAQNISSLSITPVLHNAQLVGYEYTIKSAAHECNEFVALPGKRF
jgi:prepilin-type N-terminal cleavage/methylation domain-containing protein